MTRLDWQDATWPELQDALRRNDTEAGRVPVGATEQHGPHLPTGTDTLIATAVCERAADIVGGLVLPAVPVGVSYGHGTVLPGTLSFSPSLLAELLKAYATWAAESGLRRLLFVNAHLGNTATIGTATDWLRLYVPQVRVASVDWWASDPWVAAEATADGDGIHANRAETSLVMAIAPHLARTDLLTDADDEDRTDGLVLPLHRTVVVDQRCHRPPIAGHPAAGPAAARTRRPVRGRPGRAGPGRGNPGRLRRPSRPGCCGCSTCCVFDPCRQTS